MRDLKAMSIKHFISSIGVVAIVMPTIAHQAKTAIKNVINSISLFSFVLDSRTKSHETTCVHYVAIVFEGHPHTPDLIIICYKGHILTDLVENDVNTNTKLFLSILGQKHG